MKENTYLLVGDSAKTLDATVDLYSMQSERGKYFLHEQVGDKGRKQTKKVERFLHGTSVYKVHAECKLREEGGYRRKPVTWITNSKSVAERLQQLKVVERWPKKMRSALQLHAVVNGLNTQMEIDGEIDEQHRASV